VTFQLTCGGRVSNSTGLRPADGYRHAGVVDLEAYQAINGYAGRRLRRWLRKKHKVDGAGTTRLPYEHLHDTLGLVKLRPRAHSLPRAKA
jgi:hypothetical protein